MEEEIVLYTSEVCSKCLILKRMLDSKKIKYRIEDDLARVTDFAKKINKYELPFLVITDREIYSGNDAINYGKEL